MSEKMEQRIKLLISQMSIEEKVGQLFMPAYTGRDIEYAKKLIHEFHVGGFYISNDNAEYHEEAFDLTTILNEEAQKRLCDAPLILGVDQEGAWSVLSKTSVTGPGNLALGKADEPNLTEQMHQVFADEMSIVGYNTILGPCSDVNSNPDNPIIGVRAFGETTDLVSRHVKAAVKGLHSGHVLSAAKHFPGHGDTAEDTHRKLPMVDKSLDQLLKEDLVPFKAAIDAGVDIMMTAHILYPQIDPEYPATLSKTILQDLLRDRLGFEGIIVTDSMNMWAMRKNYDPAEAAILALKAGANLVMLSEEYYENSLGNYKEKQMNTIKGVIDAVKQNQLEEGIIDRSLSRLLALKYSHPAFEPIKQFNKAEFDQTKHHQTAQIAAQKAIKLLKNEADIWPINKDGFYLVPASNPNMQERILECRGIGPNDDQLVIDVITEQLNDNLTKYKFIDYDKIDDLIKNGTDDDYPIILITENYPIAGFDHDVDAQKQIVNQMAERFKERLIVIGLRSDYELVHFPNVKTYLCAYSSRPVSARAVANMLSDL